MAESMVASRSLSDAEIAARLNRVERDKGVRILLAVESGSRAWGFPSADSDYDVRFVYVRPTFDYLSLRQPRDVIECPLEGLWDLNGWDLRKALALLEKGNPSIVEWLKSPKVYREDAAISNAMRSVVSEFGDPAQSARHYYGLLRSVWFNEFADRPEVRLKQYFYALRSAAALAWVRDRANTPPMDLPALMPVLPASIAQMVPELLAAKARRDESGRCGRIELLDAFLREMLGWAQGTEMRYQTAPGYESKANAILRAALTQDTEG